jgi:hypothetical protein
MKLEIDPSSIIRNLEIRRNDHWETLDFRRDGDKGLRRLVDDANGVRNLSLKAVGPGGIPEELRP